MLARWRFKTGELPHFEKTRGFRLVRVWGRGGLGAHSLVLGFPSVFGFWVSFGEFGIPRSLHTQVFRLRLSKGVGCGFAPPRCAL